MAAVSIDVARRNMVEYQIRCCKVLEPALIDVLVNMPREKYLPEPVRSLAYMEGSVPLPCKQEMLTPLQEAQILQALALKGTERILEIGAGTGYLTALLALHADDVVSCDIHAELVALATKNLNNNGIDNAKVHHFNAMDVDALQAANIGSNFDVIVLGAAVEKVPSHITDILAEHGQLIAFVGNDIVTLQHHQAERNSIGICETRLLPMEGVQKERTFVF
ncbi:MAG: methyltransferase domain-containing protein [Mariprofundaceae bacterium]|nr:methyltransferase domain-containing protein [Mariprofundaceae bacterium]